MKTICRICILCLLLALLLPAAVFASETQTINLTGICTGYQYTDGSTEFTADLNAVIDASEELTALLFPNGAPDNYASRNFECSWTLHAALEELIDDDTHWSRSGKRFQSKDPKAPSFSYYGMTLNEALEHDLLDQVILECAILRKQDSAVLATVDFTLGTLLHAPTFPEADDETLYLPFTAGQKLSVSFPKAAIGDHSTLYYHLYHAYDDLEADEWVITYLAKNQASPDFSYTPSEKDHGAELVCTVTLEPFSDGAKMWYHGLRYVLQDHTRPTITMPEMIGHHAEDIVLYRGESHLLKVPAASGSGENLVYRWYADYPGGGGEVAGYTTEPSLTLSFDHAIDGGSYSCEVGYRDQEDSFLSYPYMFYPMLIDKERENTQPAANQQASAPQTLQTGSSQTVSQVHAAQDDVTAMFGGSQTAADAALVNYHQEIETVADLKKVMMQAMEKEYPDLKMATSSASGQTLYDVKIQNASSADRQYVLLPYPEGLSGENMSFMVGHMFASGDRAGEIEFSKGEATQQGILAQVSGASPMLLQWESRVNEEPAVPAVKEEDASSVPVTGDTVPIAALAVLLAASLGGMLICLRRKHA